LILLSLAIDRILSMLQGALPAERTYVYLIFDSQAFISAVERVFFWMVVKSEEGKKSKSKLRLLYDIIIIYHTPLSFHHYVPPR
jgi:hypothetical protein